MKKEEVAQTPEGVRYQGSLMLALAAAFIIAGGTAVYIQLTTDTAKTEEVQQNLTTQELQTYEEATDTEKHTTADVPDSVDTAVGHTVPASEVENIVDYHEALTIVDCTTYFYDSGRVVTDCIEQAVP